MKSMRDVFFVLALLCLIVVAAIWLASDLGYTLANLLVYP